MIVHQTQTIIDMRSKVSSHFSLYSLLELWLLTFHQSRTSCCIFHSDLLLKDPHSSPQSVFRLFSRISTDLWSFQPYRTCYRDAFPTGHHHNVVHFYSCFSTFLTHVHLLNPEVVSEHMGRKKNGTGQGLRLSWCPKISHIRALPWMCELTEQRSSEVQLDREASSSPETRTEEEDSSRPSSSSSSWDPDLSHLQVSEPRLTISQRDWSIGMLRCFCRPGWVISESNLCL